MFGFAMLWSVLSASTITEPSDATDQSLLVSSYLAATRVNLFVGLPAVLIATAGLLRFKNWGRQLFAFFIAAWVIQIAGFSIFNLQLTWGISNAFTNFSLLTAGVVLSMSYTTPIAELFTRTQPGPVKSPATNLSPA
jgi:hypothetical protein